MRGPGVTVRCTNPVSERADASGTTGRRTRLPPHFDRAHNQRLLQPLAAPLHASRRTAQVGFVDLGLVLERFSLGVDQGQT